MIPLAAVIAAATAVGVGAEHRWRESAERLSGRMMTATLWTLLPIVAFFNIAALELTVEVGAGIAFAYVAQVVTLLVAWFVGTRILRLPRPAVGALMVVTAFGNTGYLGLPFTVALFGRDELPNAVVYDTLVSGLSFVTVAFSIGAAFGTRGEGARERVAAFFARNPALWATLAGFLAPDALAPDWAVEASQLLVFAVLPLGFFVVGVTLAAEAEEGASRFPPPLTRPVAWAVGLKLLLPPAIVLGLVELVRDVPDVYVTQAAMPAPLISILIANEYGLDRALTAAAIVWSTVLVVAGGLVIVLV